MREVYEAISAATDGALEALADSCLEGGEVEVNSPPEPVLVMARVRETVDGEVFNLGEVLVTRCEVLLDGKPGWGMVTGDNAGRALCAAIVDAASRSGRRTSGDDFERELGLLLAFAREARRERWAGVQPTRVEFEEMTS